MTKKTIVISLGGSIIISQSGIDINFLKKFRKFILNQVELGFSFIIVVGGGKIARNYIKDANRVVRISGKNSDWIGIAATRLNAQLLQAIFTPTADSNIIVDPTEIIKSNKKIIIGAGYKPGRSTDYDAVLIAKNHQIDTVINLSNISYVYNKNPKKYSTAKKITDIAWDDFKKIVGDRWQPGSSSPFDPIASKLAAEASIKVLVMLGKDLNNLGNCLRGKKFKGTTIS